MARSQPDALQFLRPESRAGRAADCGGISTGAPALEQLLDRLEQVLITVWARLRSPASPRTASPAGDLNWFPAPNQELRVKLQWLAIDARDATPFRIAPSGDLVAGTAEIHDFQVNNFGLQIRYRWTFAPQSDFYVVYGRGGLEVEDDPAERGLGHLFDSAFALRDSDQLILKVRYRL